MRVPIKLFPYAGAIDGLILWTIVMAITTQSLTVRCIGMACFITAGAILGWAIGRAIHQTAHVNRRIGFMEGILTKKDQD